MKKEHAQTKVHDGKNTCSDKLQGALAAQPDTRDV